MQKRKNMSRNNLPQSAVVKASKIKTSSGNYIEISFPLQWKSIRAKKDLIKTQSTTTDLEETQLIEKN